MGGDNSHNHAGCIERHTIGTTLHLQVEAYEPDSQRETRERVSPADCGTDAGEQVLGRQYVHQQDVGGGFGHLGPGSAHHGSRVPQ